MDRVRTFFRTVWFVVTDTFRSRGEAKKLWGATHFYRDMSGMSTQKGATGDASGFNAHRLKQMQDNGWRPDFGDHGQDDTDRVV